MWNKFVSAFTSIFVTATILPIAALAADSWVSDLSISPGTFNPGNGEDALISFDMFEGAYVYASASGRGDVAVYKITDGYERFDAGRVEIKWDGGYRYYDKAVTPNDYVIDIYVNSKNALVAHERVEVTVVSSVSGGKNVAPDVFGLSAKPKSFDAENNETTKLSFTVAGDAYIDAYVADVNGNKIRTFGEYDRTWTDDTTYNNSGTSHYLYWYGNDNSGRTVSNGTYYFYVTAYNDYSSDTEWYSVNVDSTDEVIPRIQSLKVSPTVFDPKKGENTTIYFNINADSYVQVYIKKNDNIIRTFGGYDYKWKYKGAHYVYWDGRNNSGNIVNDGTYQVAAYVQNGGNKTDSEFVNVKVETSSDNCYNKYGDYVCGNDDAPKIYNLNVYPKTFDPHSSQDAKFTFKVKESAYLTAYIKKGSNKIITFDDFNGDYYSGSNKNHSIYWDGTDKYGDIVDDGKYTLYVRSYINGESDIETIGVTVDSYDDPNYPYSSHKIKNLMLSPSSKWNPKSVDLNIDFELKKSVDYLDIIASKSGKKSVKIYDDPYSYYSADDYSFEWDGRDKYGDYIDSGTWKITVKTNGGSVSRNITVKYVNYKGDVKPYIKPKKTTKKYDYGSDACGGYYDLASLDENSELCKAIQWAKDEAIFSGYSDGSFKRYDTINRAEVLKVVLEAYNVPLISSKGSSLGFKDVNSNAWYMTYVKTAKEYGLLSGYAKGNKAGMSDDINRAEILKFVLEAASEVGGYDLEDDYSYSSVYADVKASKWYYQYAMAAYKYGLFDDDFSNGKQYLRPAKLVVRGEVALLLYRMNKAGLL